MQAILAGRKTQTRRVIKPQPNPIEPNRWFDRQGPENYWVSWDERQPAPPSKQVWIKSPYGRPGDRLYVRETWRTWAGHDELRPSELDSYGPCQYKADMAVYNGHRDWGRWRSSIHMPEWASRIWLRMTDVRVGRVQEISVVDVEAEGVMEINPYDYGERDDTPRGRFGCLWDSINAPRGYGWEKNPFVWVISFEKIDA